MLQYIGSQLGCENIFLYERMDNGEFLSTYHWAPTSTEHPLNLSLQVEYPQHLQSLYRNEVLIFSDSDDRLPSPSQFSSQQDFADIHTLVLSPVLSKGRIIALLRLDNPAHSQNIRHHQGLIALYGFHLGAPGSDVSFGRT